MYLSNFFCSANQFFSVRILFVVAIRSFDHRVVIIPLYLNFKFSFTDAITVRGRNPPHIGATYGFDLSKVSETSCVIVSTE